MHTLQLQGPAIPSYAEARDLWVKAEFPKDSVRIGSWLRMCSVGGGEAGFDFFLSVVDPRRCSSFGRLTPDNVFEFTLDYRVLRPFLTYKTVYVWPPFTAVCRRNKLNRIGHVTNISDTINSLQPGTYRDKVIEDFNLNKNVPYWVMLEQNMYKKGLRFNMGSGECLNPGPSYIENPEDRRIWHIALAKFKAGIIIRAKIGVFNSIIDKVLEESGEAHFYTNRPDWNFPRRLDLLGDCIRDNTFPQELLMDFTMSINVWSGHNGRPTVNNVVGAVNRILKNKSFELRKRFGVFEG